MISKSPTQYYGGAPAPWLWLSFLWYSYTKPPTEQHFRILAPSPALLADCANHRWLNQSKSWKNKAKAWPFSRVDNLGCGLWKLPRFSSKILSISPSDATEPSQNSQLIGAPAHPLFRLARAFLNIREPQIDMVLFRKNWAREFQLALLNELRSRLHRSVRVPKKKTKKNKVAK